LFRDSAFRIPYSELELPVPRTVGAGRAAADLPWLCPQTDSLIALAEDPAALARLSAADPALLAFLLRFSPSEPFTLDADRYLSPNILDTACHFLSLSSGFLPPLAALQPRRVADRAAVFAHRLAHRTQSVSPFVAEAVARLAPLGWFAVAAIDGYAFAECLADPAFRLHPSRTQVAHWGLDHDAIARRLAVRWRLPAFAATILGNLNVPFRAGRTTAADADLFAVVQLAVHQAEVGTHDLGLTKQCDPQELLRHLRVELDDAAFHPPAPPPELPGTPTHDPNPHRVPLLPNLLRATAESRRRNGAALVVRLESRVDELTRGLAELSNQTGNQLRDAKLAGLAELAAGAGHEINNPLAVISSHAQRLARTEGDPERAESLRTIIKQTQRIHTLLRDMMQFARPPRAESQRFLACELLAAVRDEFAPLAESQKVKLQVELPPADVWLEADVKQVRHAVAAVVRNGVEAAPRGGWVKVSCAELSGRVEVLVEDSGPGLSGDVQDHAFDPFYCGRSAGRGRGLGLSTAWRFARQNGGDVRHDTTPDGPTRFVVVIPRAACGERAGRLSA
jgi:two-component system NtrC family sensor kinase